MARSSFGSHWGSFAAGAAIGTIGAMLLDPRRGAARRALIVQKVGAFLREAVGTARGRVVDLGHRARGAAHETAARLREEHVDDSVLVERVRSRIGRPLSHAHAVQVSAHEGTVTVRGEVLPGELGELLSTVAHVRGVRRVISEVRTAEPGEARGH